MKFGLDWKRDSAPAPGEKSLFGEPAKFQCGVYQLHSGVWAWMQPNGSWGESNAGIVSDGGETLVFDSLFDLKMTRNMLNAIKPIVQHAPVKTLVNSHANGDHTFGNQLFRGARIVATDACAHEMSEEGPEVLLKGDVFARTLSCCGLGGMPLWPLRRLDKYGKYFRRIFEPYDFKGIRLTLPTETFTDRYHGQVGSIPYQLIKLGPAHTEGDIILYLPEQKTIFAGDILFVEGTPAAWNVKIDNWIRAIDIIDSMDVEIIVPGHGPIIAKAGMDDLRTYLTMVIEKTECYYKNKTKPYDIAKQLLLQDKDFKSFRLWDSPERLVIATNTVARALDGEIASYTPIDRIKVLWGSARLAYELPDTAPRIVHTW